MRRRTPNEAVSIEQLRALGVLSWHLNTTDLESDPKLAAIRAARGYSYHVRAAWFIPHCNFVPQTGQEAARKGVLRVHRACAGA